MSSADARSPLMPQMLMLAMIAIWGASFAAIKAALNASVPEMALIAGRFWLAIVAMLPFLPSGYRLASLAATWRNGCITGFALLMGYLLQTYGMQETTSSVGSFMTGLIVLLVALGARFVFGERMPRAKVLGLALGFCGLCMICLGATNNETGTSSLRGILLQVGSSTCYAAHVLLISRLSPPGKATAFCWWQLSVVAAGASCLVPLTGGLGPIATYIQNPTVWLNLAYLGLLATALGIGVQSSMQPRIHPSQVAVLFATQPAFGALAGVLLLGDSLGAWEWLGGVVIVASVVIASRGDRIAAR
jgi:drug/metabolite transporter (DMT)-like permease